MARRTMATLFSLSVRQRSETKCTGHVRGRLSVFQRWIPLVGLKVPVIRNFFFHKLASCCIRSIYVVARKAVRVPLFAFNIALVFGCIIACSFSVLPLELSFFSFHLWISRWIALSGSVLPSALAKMYRLSKPTSGVQEFQLL